MNNHPHDHKINHPQHINTYIHPYILTLLFFPISNTWCLLSAVPIPPISNILLYLPNSKTEVRCILGIFHYVLSQVHEFELNVFTIYSLFRRWVDEQRNRKYGLDAKCNKGGMTLKLPPWMFENYGLAQLIGRITFFS